MVVSPLLLIPVSLEGVDPELLETLVRQVLSGGSPQQTSAERAVPAEQAVPGWPAADLAPDLKKVWSRTAQRNREIVAYIVSDSEHEDIDNVIHRFAPDLAPREGGQLIGGWMSSMEKVIRREFPGRQSPLIRDYGARRYRLDHAVRDILVQCAVADGLLEAR